MSFGEGVWKSVHMIATLAIMRFSDVLAANRASTAMGVAAGIGSGLAIETLIASLRNRVETRPMTARRYLNVAIRLPMPPDFFAAIVVCVLWFGVSPGGRLSVFKFAWLFGAFVVSKAFAGSSYSHRTA